jgi:hypothetical protein
MSGDGPSFREWSVDRSRRSERRTRPGRPGRAGAHARSRLARCGSVVAVLCVLAASGREAVTAQAPDPSWRLGGEHGLWVRHEGGRVDVRWTTDRAERGSLEAFAGGKRIARARTRAGQAHRATFRARGAEELVLRYGALDRPDDQHETVVGLRRPERGVVAVTGVDSLYVLGDTHGDYDAVVEGLRAAGLLDDELRWSGGTSHLVFAGDLVDRGPDVLALLWLAYRLEREAAAAGGGVHVVLGNHEVMVLLGDLRYVHPKELYVAALHEATYRELFDVRSSVLGRWLASRPGLLRVDRALVAHGGLGERYAGYGLVEYDDSLASYVGEELFARWTDTSWAPPLDSAALARRDNFFWDDDSAFWHRAYVQTDTAGALLDRVLDRMESDLLVVGHTPVRTLAAAYDGRLIAAHTPRHGAELLLLVRRPGGYDRYRVSAAGQEPF